MNGAEALLATAAACGIDVCFANPGTTELDLVAALDDSDQIRSVPVLFEGVCAGAADGYSRIAGRPALTLTHLGPGFANSLANNHNARRARTPIINIIGDHAGWHLDADAPLTSDIESLASPMSVAVETIETADDVGPGLSGLVAGAKTHPTGPATMIIRQDAAWSPTAIVGDAPDIPAPPIVAADRIAAAGGQLRERRAILMVGGSALDADSLRRAAAIGEATGATVMTESLPVRQDRGSGIPAPKRLPYFPEPARAALEDHDVIVLVGTDKPVSFFGYREGSSSPVPDDVDVVALAGPGDDAAAAIAALADAVDAIVSTPEHSPEHSPVELPSTDDISDTVALDPVVLGRLVAEWLPENAIVVDETISSGAGFLAASAHAHPHTTLGITGGAIGGGLPCAVGAAVAAPERPVVAVQADGSAAYTVQALWTMAREELDVTIVLLSNRSYRILQVELARAGKPSLGAVAGDLTDLDRPGIDWVSLAAGFGVGGTTAATAGELRKALGRATTTTGPFLIEAALP